LLVFSSNPEPILAERKGGDSATFLAALLSHCFLRKMWLAARPVPLGLVPSRTWPVGAFGCGRELASAYETPWHAELCGRPAMVRAVLNDFLILLTGLPFHSTTKLREIPLASHRLMCAIRRLGSGIVGALFFVAFAPGGWR
jgi:hypothetical protein